MLPSIEDWLSASWTDFKRRWGALMVVVGVSGLVTAFGVLLPLVPAGLAQLFGAASPWLIWGGAFFAALLTGLWLSTWAQAAALRAATGDAGAADALAYGWKKTWPFMVVFGLVTCAIAGGLVLLVLPGVVLAGLLAFAPFYQMDGEAEGMAALELSWARAKPRLGAVLVRLLIAWLIVLAPGWLPWIGWLIAPLWAPFGLVALARLAADLKAAAPEAQKPAETALAVWAATAILCLALGAGAYGAARGLSALKGQYESGALAAKAPDEATARALLAVLQGKGTAEDNEKALSYAISLSSTGAIALPAEPLPAPEPAPEPQR
jgi:hypothetical protein